jgi:hypothetical protein
MVNHIPLFGENMCSHWNCIIIIIIKKKLKKIAVNMVLYLYFLCSFFGLISRAFGNGCYGRCSSMLKSNTRSSIDMSSSSSSFKLEITMVIV